MLSAGGSEKPQARPFVRKVIVWQFTGANHGILAGNNAVSELMNTENDSEMMIHIEGRKLHRKAKIHSFLEMWKSNRHLHAT
jgi:hypothetical protein